MTTIWIDVKYINVISYRLERFSWSRPGKVAKCRCPICGDSYSDKTKTRGYFLVKPEGTTYFCHNCGISAPLRGFLEDNFPNEYQEYRLECFSEYKSANPPPVSDDTTDDDDPLPAIDARPKFKPKDFLTTHATKLSSLPDDHIAVRYVKSRRLKYDDFWYTDNFGDVVCKFEESYQDSSIPNEPRLIIPFRGRTGVMEGFQGRALLKSGLRYITVKKPDTDIIFGLDRVDFKKNTFVFEGALDSTFIPNSIAASGSSLQRLDHILTEEELSSCIFVWDNEPRNPEIVRNMKKMLDRGYRVVVWTEETPKDINNMILSGKTRLDIAHLIRNGVCKGPIGLLRLSKWKRV